MTRPRKPKLAAANATMPDIIAANDMVEVGSGAVGKAKAGNVHAIEVVERMWRHQPVPLVKLDLPPVTDAASLADAQVKVIDAAANRAITAQDGLRFVAMLECRRRGLALIEYEARLIALEQAGEERARREREAGTGRGL